MVPHGSQPLCPKKIGEGGFLNFLSDCLMLRKNHTSWSYWTMFYH